MIVKVKKKLPCQKCELCNNIKEPMKSIGPVDSDIMIITDYPGIRESQYGKPLQGKPGAMFYKLMEQAEINPKECYITHAVKCNPKGVEKPTTAEYKACLPNLLKEIEQVKPKFVLIMGSGIVQPMLKVGFKKNKNCIVTKDGIQYMIINHPSGVVKKPSLEKLLLGNFKRFKRLITGNLSEGEEFNWHLVSDGGKFKKFLRELEVEKIISYDIETTGLNCFDKNIYLGTIGFGLKGKEWVVPFNHPEAPWCGNHKLHNKMIAKIILAMQGKTCIAHNGKFDNKFLRFRYGYAPLMTADTMLMSYALDENEPNGLKELSKIYCNANDYAIDTTNILKFPLLTVAEYNAYDVHYTRRLYFIFLEKLKKDPKTKRIYDKIIMAASKPYEDAELHGVYIDPVKMAEAFESNFDITRKLLKQLNDMFPEVTNWNSGPQINKLLFETLKMPILERTAKGRPSNSGETVLPRLKDKHPVIQILLDYRENRDLGKFLTGWKKAIDPVTHRMHPNFLIHGTVTGRPSCKEPNLQNTPKNELLRSLITAPPGWVLIESDYSQAELRIGAMMSGDPVMKMCYQTGIDVHLKTASSVSGVPLEKVTKPMRKKAKAVNFGESLLFKVA